MRAYILLTIAATLPGGLGFASHGPACVDSDGEVPALAASLGVYDITSCAGVLLAGYCPRVPSEMAHYCCASCFAPDRVSDREARKGGGPAPAPAPAPATTPAPTPAPSCPKQYTYTVNTGTFWDPFLNAWASLDCSKADPTCDGLTWCAQEAKRLCPGSGILEHAGNCPRPNEGCGVYSRPDGSGPVADRDGRCWLGGKGASCGNNNGYDCMKLVKENGENKGVCRDNECQDGNFYAKCGHDGDCNGDRRCVNDRCSCSTTGGDTQCLPMCECSAYELKFGGNGLGEVKRTPSCEQCRQRPEVYDCDPENQNCDSVPRYDPAKQRYGGGGHGVCLNHYQWNSVGGVAAVYYGQCQTGKEGALCGSDGDCISGHCYEGLWHSANYGYKKCSPHVYDYPRCVTEEPSCLVNNGGCQNGPCHQVIGRVYRVDGTGARLVPPRKKCYRALTGCWGCLQLGSDGEPIGVASGHLDHYGTCPY